MQTIDTAKFADRQFPSPGYRTPDPQPDRLLTDGLDHVTDERLTRLWRSKRRPPKGKRIYQLGVDAPFVPEKPVDYI